MKRLLVALLVVAAFASMAVVPVQAVAGPGGHIYGVVFVDGDHNGVWGNEAGMTNVPVHFVSGATHITLYSAWTDNRISALSGPTGEVPPDQYCSHLDEAHIQMQKGCNGTFGLTPTWGWWKVYIDVPAGCSIMKGGPDNPYYVPTLGKGETWTGQGGVMGKWLEFPLVCTGADDPAVAPLPGIKVVMAPKSAGISNFQTPYTAVPMRD